MAALGGLCIALSSIFIKVAGTSGSTSAFWRCLFALPLLAVFAWREQASRRRVLLPLLAGVGLGLDFVLWGDAIPRIGAGIATVLLSIQVVIVPALAFAFFAERPSRRFVLATPVLLGGIVLAGGFAGTGTDPLSGAFAALGAGAAFAGYLLLIRRSGAPVWSVFMATGSAFFVAAVLGFGWGTLDLTPGWRALGWMAALAVIGQVTGWLLIGAALPRMSAATGAALMLLQPVGAVLMGIGLLGETPGVVQLIGCAAVLAAVCFASRRTKLTPTAD